MIEKIKDIESEIERRFNKADLDYCGFQWFYRNHLSVVKDTALSLAKIFNADEEIIYLASILHDIGYLIEPKNHLSSGMKEAKKIMEKNGIGNEIIEKVLYCIEMHDKMIYPKTPEARIIQIADAISHTNPNFLSSMKKIKKEKFDDFLKRKTKKIEWILGWNCYQSNSSRKNINYP